MKNQSINQVLESAITLNGFESLEIVQSFLNENGHDQLTVSRGDEWCITTPYIGIDVYFDDECHKVTIGHVCANSGVITVYMGMVESAMFYLKRYFEFGFTSLNMVANEGFRITVDCDDDDLGGEYNSSVLTEEFINESLIDIQ
ncbi:hypothetical protein NVP3058O_142 [Vibrio phage 3.058.O._10N.286.46.B8]|nr:hypothetical protein NVP2058O_143 [Vibrio phage 2.058.O._10N.286.46.B8]AUS03212.1 hypothetical protein NVP3058O_142 [Vibrio phage 3.058.O._10N.286.46.B8]